MRAAVIVFPGTWSDGDCLYALSRVGVEGRRVWHRESPVFERDELVVLPGGFSYGDYLRCGAIARFSPVMESVRAHAEAGGIVIGICNGFQILCEAGLLPGVLMRNDSLQFRCQTTHLVAAEHASPFTCGIEADRVLAVPISHGEGNYFADEATLDMLEASGRVAFRYSDAEGRVTPEANPNGSLRNIAGVLSEGRNVLGMMPHPERACDPLLGGEDGNAIWQSILSTVAAPVAASQRA
jgi:phosphoribosylformylglycinamidine synthase